MSQHHEWLTFHEAARLLGLTRETLARLVRRGSIPVDDSVPRAPRIHRDDLDRYIESCRIQPGTLGIVRPAPRRDPGHPGRGRRHHL